MGMTEIVGILIFAVVINVILWRRGFYSRSTKSRGKLEGFINVDGKYHKFDENLPREERVEKMSREIAKEFLKKR